MRSRPSSPALRCLWYCCWAVCLFFSCEKPNLKRFSTVPAEVSGIEFNNRVPDQTPDGMNFIQYLYYYNGGGVAAADFDKDGYCDLLFSSNLEQTRLYRNKGDFHFEDITAASGIAAPATASWATGLSVADVNADGWPDVYICRVGRYKQWNGRNELWINEGAKNGQVHFKESAAEYGLDLQAFSTQAVFFDVDADEDLDCFIACHSVHSAGSYRDTSLTRRFDPLAADRLYRNDQGQFTDVSAQMGIYGGTAGYALGLLAGDFNGDHRPDLYVANDFHENDYFYQNTDGKGFRERITTALPHTSNFSMGCDLADLNNDGAPELITLDMKPEAETLLKASQPADPYDVYQYKHSLGYHWQFARNTLQLNQTPGAGKDYRGIDIAAFAGMEATDWSWSALLADLDLDGWRDAFITNGIVRRPNDMDYLKFISSSAVQQKASDLELIRQMPGGQSPNYVFRNRGDLTFEDNSQTWGLDFSGCSNGAIYADLDNDGDLDLVSNNINSPASVLRNETIQPGSKQPAPNYVNIRLEAEGANTFAIGAKVWCYAGGQVQYAENMPVRGFQSCVQPGFVSFGLGRVSLIDSLLVRWPNGHWSRLHQPAANQVHLLNSRTAQPAPLDIPVADAPIFTEKRKWPAHEPLIEAPAFFEQKIQPWAGNTHGPSLSTGDLNADGQSDLFVRSVLWGHEQWQPGAALDQGICASAIFDIEGDGDLDIAYGLANSAGNAPRFVCLQQQANGRFEALPAQNLPRIEATVACIRPADMDGDGDQDLFVGLRSLPGKFASAPPSLLLTNEGAGMFRSAPLDTRPGGTLSDARWADLDGDGRSDLVVCGEWMPLTIFFNTEGGWKRSEIPNSSGLWQQLAIADTDRDGDTDLVAGNIGINTHLRASVQAPLELWMGDLDNNGEQEPVLAYYRQGKKWIWADKDALSNQVPAFRKQFVEYKKYALSTFDAVIPPAMQARCRRYEAVCLESTVFENKGQGQWQARPLPSAAQWGSVNAILARDIDQDGYTDLLLAGNFFEVHPAIGRLDAQCGTFLRGQAGGSWSVVPPQQSGFYTRDAIRDLQWVSGGVLAAGYCGVLRWFEVHGSAAQ